jgi:hypothetical protein
MEQLSTIQQINSAIMFGNLSNVELNSIVDAVKFARTQLTKQNKRAFQLGDTVKFTSNRNGLTYVGTVRKVKIKFVLVNTPGGLFNVPANMLEAA